jgi:hypothetical protein
MVSAMATLATVEAAPRDNALPDDAVDRDLFSYEFQTTRDVLNLTLDLIWAEIHAMRTEASQRSLTPSRLAA